MKTINEKTRKELRNELQSAVDNFMRNLNLQKFAEDIINITQTYQAKRVHTYIIKETMSILNY